MKKSIVILLTLFLTYTCSKDKTEAVNEARDYSISGKFVTPNGIDAISKAKVQLFENNTIVKETITDSEGNFTISDIVAGDYNLKISKGLFTASRSISSSSFTNIIDLILDNIEITEIPNIAVVTGSWDHIEDVLYNIGLADSVTQEPLFDIIDGSGYSGRLTQDHGHRHEASTQMNRTTNSQLQPNVDFTFSDLIASPDLMANYDIIFLNCGLDEGLIELASNITNYVNNGGLIYATDWAFVYLNDITNDGSNYLSFYDPPKSGTSLSTEAVIVNDDLMDWLALNYNITITDNSVIIDEFLGGWQVVDTYDETSVIPWLNGPIEYDGITENKYLAYTFTHGDGGVLYSSFHTENETDEATNVERLMQYLVFELSDLHQN